MTFEDSEGCKGRENRGVVYIGSTDEKMEPSQTFYHLIGNVVCPIREGRRIHVVAFVVV